MIEKWVLFISSRYINSGRKRRRLSPGLLSAVGIAVGVMALICVISVMNGFQMGFIEDILEISSYHVRINEVEPGYEDEIALTDGVKSVMPFYETKTLAASKYQMSPCIVKGVPADTAEIDPGFFKQLNIFRGNFNPYAERTVVIGRILAIKLGVNIGDSISIVALDGGTFRNLRPETNEFIVSGLFQSGYDEFDTAMMVTSTESLLTVDSSSDLKYGIKIENRFRDRQVSEALLEIDGIEAENITSWREYSKALFSALRLEKSVMFILLGLIFLVVSFGIFNSTRRTIAEKQEEIGILRAIGSTPSQIRRIFVLDGLIIGLAGGICGLFLGIIVTVNINSILGFLSLNSSFLINMPVRIIPGEIVSIFTFAVVFCVFSSLAASAKVSTITPQEVLRYE